MTLCHMEADALGITLGSNNLLQVPHPPQVVGIAFAKWLQNGYNPFVPANPNHIRRYIP